MRMLALAAACGATLMAGVAVAETYSDSHLTVTLPDGWGTDKLGPDSSIGVLAFNSSNDCFFFSIPNAASANSTASAARNTTTPMTQTEWTTAAGVAQMRQDFFPSGATVTSSSVDTSGFWPVQRAQLQGAKTVQAAIQVRPGFELRAFCSGNADFAPIFASIAHPNDAAWRAQAEQQATDRAAQQAANDAAAQQQQQQQQQQPRREELDGVDDGVERASRDPRARRRRD